MVEDYEKEKKKLKIYGPKPHVYFSLSPFCLDSAASIPHEPNQSNQTDILLTLY